jgi:hypothetical protein
MSTAHAGLIHEVKLNFSRISTYCTVYPQNRTDTYYSTLLASSGTESPYFTVQLIGNKGVFRDDSYKLLRSPGDSK